MSAGNFNNDPELFKGLRAVLLKQEEERRDTLRVCGGHVIQVNHKNHGNVIARFDDDTKAERCLKLAGFVKQEKGSKRFPFSEFTVDNAGGGK